MARDVDEAVHIVLRNSAGYPIGSLDMYVLQGEIPNVIFSRHPVLLAILFVLQTYLVG